MSQDAKALLQPLISLLGKSEKSQLKLAPGTWQHTMLQDNIDALRMGLALLDTGEGVAPEYPRDELQRASVAFATMITKTEKALAMFERGTSQHTLQMNRLAALRAGGARVREALQRPL